MQRLKELFVPKRSHSALLKRDPGKHNVPKCSHTTKIILVLFQKGIMQEAHTTVKEVVQNVFAELFLREMQENKGRPHVYRKQ